MSQDLKGNIAVITGSASGIGLAIATKCASVGCNLALIDIDQTGLTNVKSHLSNSYPTIQIETFLCDVSDYNQLKSTVKDIQLKFSTNSIQALFNNVGISCMGDILYSKYGNSDDTDMGRLRKTMDCNLWSMIYLTRLCLPLLLNTDSNKQCYIANTGSIGSMLYANGFYYITKHAILSFSQTIATEIKQIFKKQKRRNNIHIATLCPGYVKNTNFYKTSQRIHNIDDKEYNEIMKDMEQIDTQVIDAISVEVGEVMQALFEGLRLKRSVIYTHKELLYAGIEDNIKHIKEGKKYYPQNMSKVIMEKMKERAKL